MYSNYLDATFHFNHVTFFENTWINYLSHTVIWPWGIPPSVYTCCTSLHAKNFGQKRFQAIFATNVFFLQMHPLIKNTALLKGFAILSFDIPAIAITAVQKYHNLLSKSGIRYLMGQLVIVGESKMAIQRTLFPWIGLLWGSLNYVEGFREITWYYLFPDKTSLLRKYLQYFNNNCTYTYNAKEITGSKNRSWMLQKIKCASLSLCIHGNHDGETGVAMHPNFAFRRAAVLIFSWWVLRLCISGMWTLLVYWSSWSLHRTNGSRLSIRYIRSWVVLRRASCKNMWSAHTSLHLQNKEESNETVSQRTVNYFYIQEQC